MIDFMKISLLGWIFFGVSTTVLQAQALQTKWVTSLGGNKYEQSNGIAVAPCGDVYQVGFFQQQLGNLTTVGTEDGFIAKYNSAGDLIWLKNLGGTSTDRLSGITIINDNQIVVSGEIKGTLRYNATDSLVALDRLDALVLSIDSSGQVQWAKIGSGLGDDSAVDITHNANGTICVTGYFEQNLQTDQTIIQSFGNRDAFIWALDTNGQTQWTKKLGWLGFDEGLALAMDDDYGYITGLYRDQIVVDNDTLLGKLGADIFVTKFDHRTGQSQWTKTVGGPSSDRVQSVAVDQQGNICITGWYSANITVQGTTLLDRQEEDAYLIKFDSNGQLVWAKSLGHEFDERGYEVGFDPQDNVYLMGTLDSLLIIGGDSLTNRHLNRPADIFIAKFDAQGDYKWSQTLGHYYNDFCYDMQIIDASTIYITGSFQDTTIFMTDTMISQFGYDIFVAKFEMDTLLTIKTLAEAKIVPTLTLFPNPSSIGSTLLYELTKTTTVKIVLYDGAGRPVRQLYDAIQPIGEHELWIDRKELPNGYYWVQLEIGGTIFVQALLLQ